VHVHRRGSDNLLKVIPARILPKEYGGEAGSLMDHWGKELNVLTVSSAQSLTLSTKLNLFYHALRFISFRILNLQVKYLRYQLPCRNDHH
jgi:hypothetical protein